MKAKDNQITGREFDQHLYIKNSYSRTCYGWKHIPIECWSEIDSLYIPDGKFLYIQEDHTEIRNSGGHTYLVTLIGKGK